MSGFSADTARPGPRIIVALDYPSGKDALAFGGARTKEWSPRNCAEADVERKFGANGFGTSFVPMPGCSLPMRREGRA